MTRPKPLISQPPEAPPEPAVEGREAENDEGREYMAKMLEDPLWEFKRTMEVRGRQFKLKEMNEQLQHVESYSSRLKSELHAKNTEFHTQYNDLMAECKALLGMRMQDEAPKAVEDADTYFEDKNLLSFYAYNQSLLAEVEARQKAKQTQEMQPQTIWVRPKHLTPAVKRRPENWQTQDGKSRVTTRMSQAFKSVESAVRESKRVKQLVGTRR
jgi:hypothetical protein